MRDITAEKAERASMYMKSEFHNVTCFMKKLVLIFLYAIVLPAYMSSCGDREQNPDLIPDVPVSITVNLDLPAYFELQNIGTFYYFAGGAKGVMLYHGYDGEFYAFERNCPHQPFQDCSMLWMDSLTKLNTFCGTYSNGVYTKCCESRFELPTGMPVNGPATRAMRQYFVSRSGNILYINN